MTGAIPKNYVAAIHARSATGAGGSKWPGGMEVSLPGA